MAIRAQEVAQQLRSASFEELPGLLACYQTDERTQVRHAVDVAMRRYESEKSERERVSEMYRLERELGGSGVVVGVDEVGRGAVAGPLTVAAVVLPDEPLIWGINDSKQLSAQRREELAEKIFEHARAVGMCHVPPQDIDKFGMAACLRQAMAGAVADTGLEPDCVLIDGNPVHAHPRERTIVKGDARIASIAAASIVAKVTRDRLMSELDEQYPGYYLAQCKGYASSEHIGAIRKLGCSPIHRTSFCGNFMEMPTLF